MGQREFFLPDPRSTPMSSPARPDAEVETVSALTRRIRQALKGAITPTWVRGEISNARVQSSGHVYFSLKDATACIACVMFRGDAVRSGSGATLRDGAQVIVFGEIDVYEPRGNYQLIARVALDEGRGKLQQEFERLKQQLAAEGLFDPARKRPLPALPQVVGFITSPTGAAVQDFIRILLRRGWRGRLVVLPARVQGEGAAAELTAMLGRAQQIATRAHGVPFDLLVIGRGGGSLEDLWAFNDEALVRAIANCRIPVISAVGHEIDFTLADFAADVRAETPSAAAELISSRFLDTVERVRLALERLDGVGDDVLDEHRSTLDELRHRLGVVAPAARVEREYLRLDDLMNRLQGAVRHELHLGRQRVGGLAERLAHAGPRETLARVRERVRALESRFGREIEVWRTGRRQALARLEERLRAAGPEAALRRGFVILWDQDRRPVTSRESLQPSQKLTAQWHDGEAPVKAEP